jgi:hypothetical protein
MIMAGQLVNVLFCLQQQQQEGGGGVFCRFC